ncbi:MAG TPA: hypothetical protein VFC19_22495, partial [Candidatus Limnocylindrales bacterium]|nr:hypothetical protein [Candidatus Limnocylindrales bacterium]
MSSRDIFAGIFSGLAERSREKQETLLAQEMARQKAAAEFWKSMADRPDIRPEARDRFLQKYALVLNNAPGKKLPKEASLDTLFDEIQPQVGSPSWQGGQTTREVTATPMPIPGSLEDPLKPSVPPPVTMSAPVPQPPPGYGMSPFYSPDEQRAQTQRDLEAQLATRAKFAGQTAEAEEAAKAKYREAPAPRPIDARSPQGIAAELQLEEEKKKRGLGTYALKPDTSMSEVELAMAAAGGDKQAKMALDLLTRMKTAGQIEGGVYTAITDRRGVVQGFVNPKTRQVIRMEDLGFEGENFKGAMGIDRQTREEAASSGLRAIT